MGIYEVISRKVAKARGLDRYFTGVPCKHGHVVERRTDTCACVECLREYDRKYDRKYYERNKEAKREYNREYYGQNRESQREYRREHYAKNKEALLERVRFYRERKSAELGCHPSTLRDRKRRAEALGCSIDQLPTRLQQTEPSRFVYVIEVHGLHRPMAKVGITNDLDKRLRTHKHELAKSGLTYSVLKLVDMGTEDAAREVERWFKGCFEPSPIEVISFRNELFELNPFMHRFIENIQGIEELALAA